MKSILSFGIGIALLTGCGIQKATEDTRDLVATSNTTQTGILQNIEKTLRETTKVKDATHLFAMSVALGNMTTGPAATVLFPMPVLMLPYAKAFTTEASEEEILEAEFIFYSAAQLPSTGDEQTPDVLKTRAVSYAAFMSIAGVTPPDKASNILASISNPKQPLPQMVAAFAVARYTLSKGLLGLKLDPTKNPILNQGVLNNIVDYFKAMKQIALMPNAQTFGYEIEIPTLLPKNAVAVDSKEALAKLGSKVAGSVKMRAPELYNANSDLLKELSIP
jgi:hypothetical protein